MKQGFKIEIIQTTTDMGEQFFVGCGERFESGLTPDEALFVVAQMLVQPEKIPTFLRTPQEHTRYAAENEWLGSPKKDIRQETAKCS